MCFTIGTHENKNITLRRGMKIRVHDLAGG